MTKANPIWIGMKYISLLIAVFVVLYPPYIIVANAFKTPDEYLTKSTMSLPDSFVHFSNFADAFSQADMGRAFGNTIIIVCVTLLLNVLIGASFCYAVTRFKFKLQGPLVGLFLFATIIPQITTQVINFKTIQGLGLTNHLMGPTLLYVGADILQIYIYMQFIRNIPYDLDEAAMMEGASLFKIFYVVILPLLGPATATIIILKTISIYNDMFTPFLYLTKPELVVVSTSLMRFFGSNSGNWQMVSAAILIIMIPTAVMFVFLQRYIFAGVTQGAVK
ncbi:binding-protein-dependent transport systems inner membrane component [Paenibacillus curdlanolyticus YK9]|uniref:Binding-protein-dependent transport systems inner membrane component n=1 Tax=Paenibacillus curdlanolyticus YK9 TaxID=717606 RepID=E0ICQ4_9BACL|nr:carbohydrate ABC transporter permease [Paenibacillus curdlanolyticus]EFM09940.1 binding-protein-dependent transport systems inner membrane component [Paenibacillus curdlanolyticus YK9]